MNRICKPDIKKHVSQLKYNRINAKLMQKKLLD